MCADAGEERKRARPAMSDGNPKRPERKVSYDRQQEQRHWGDKEHVMWRIRQSAEGKDRNTPVGCSALNASSPICLIPNAVILLGNNLLHPKFSAGMTNEWVSLTRGR